MKESIGATQLFVIVIVMVLIFASIITFTTNKSNAFAVKDAIITIIEENNGFQDTYNPTPDTALGMIKDKLEDLQYRVSGNCPSDYDYHYKRNGDHATGNEKAAFCIKKISGSGGVGTVKDKNTYRVMVFYGVDIPFFNQLFSFSMVGETKGVE